MSYEKRFVAFVDILGFKALIDQTTVNLSEYERIKKVLEYIAGIQKDNYEGFLSEYGIHKEITVFSDSIIISYAADVSFGGALFHVLMDLVHMCLDLFWNNIYFRGGVTYGDMYHNRNVCFGPAMIRAYEIETEIAINPRIVVDELAILENLRRPGNANTPEMEAEYLLDLLRQDRAGTFWLDVLRQRQEADDPYDYQDMLVKMRSNLINHLNAGYVPRVHKKYVWLAKYYNKNLYAITNRRAEGLKMRSNLTIDKSLL